MNSNFSRFFTPVLGLGMIFLLIVAVSETLRGASHDSLEEFHIEVDGVMRTYFFHRPKNSLSEKLPLLMVFHGGGGDGLKIGAQTGFTGLSDRERFAVVYPNSLDYWHDGRDTVGRDENDMLFVSKLIELLVESEAIDPRRIFAVGASNGGMFTLRLACEKSGEIAAFAAVIASFPVSYRPDCRPKGGVSIMMINGTEDRFIKWRGGTIPKGRRIGRGGEVIPVPDTVQFWVVHNGCEPTPTERRLPDLEDDGTEVAVMTYQNCRNGGSVELVKIIGGGHTWPGSPMERPRISKRIMGNTSRDINGSEMIWEYLQKHARD
jgi:polyhydroxybutyrate depolymerase